MRKEKIQKKQILFWCILLAGIAIRIWRLGIVPGEVLTDEAFSSYESYSLLTTGKDTFGYHNPVYLTAWGSGMNALQSYLMMPWISLFGMNLLTIRIPQVLIACISLPVFYKTVKKLFSEKIAFIAFFILAISPWHIMMARWGLESNLAPGFLLFGFYYFLKGCDNNKYFLISALFYGCSLYCYSTLWVYVPLVLILSAVWMFWQGKLKINRYIIGAVIILAVMAVPLILFVMVNTGWMEEIHTGLFSVPRLVAMREDGYSLSHIPGNFLNFCKRFLLQNDWGGEGSPIKWFGQFYQFSMPFVLLGGVALLRNFYQKKGKTPETLVIINLLVSFLLCLVVHVNIVRMNFLHLWTIILIAVGIQKVCEKFRQWKIPILALYTVSFLIFSVYYFHVYAETYPNGLEEAVHYARASEKAVYVGSEISYPKIMYYSQVSPQEYQDTVTFSNYPNEFLAVSSFGKYHMYTDKIEAQGIYNFEKETWTKEELKGYQVKQFGDYICIIT